MFYRWDWVWKEFLNPERPWCKYFVSKLVPSTYADYTVDFGADFEKASLISLDKEQHFGRKVQVADKFLMITADTKQKVLHLEFESKFTRDIGMRALRYGIAQAEQLEHKREEIWRLPDPVIVNVCPNSGSSSRFHKLTLHVGSDLVSIDYPVVNGYDKVEYVGNIMNASTMQEAEKAIHDLQSDVPSFIDSAIDMDMFFLACSALRFPEVFEDGVDEKEVVVMSQAIQRDMRPAREVWKEEGKAEGKIEGREELFEEIITSIMKSKQYTREQALNSLADLTGAVDSASGTSQSVQKMKLRG